MCHAWGKSAIDFPVYVYEAFAEKENSGTLELICWNLAAEEIAELKLNGAALQLKTLDNNWSDPQVYCDKPQVTAGGWRAFPIAPEYKLTKISFDFSPTLIKDGINLITIRLNTSSSFAKIKTIEKIELYLINID